jgi:leader peptidase (prepilin peptidase)/N-methyltransferase
LIELGTCFLFVFGYLSREKILENLIWGKEMGGAFFPFLLLVFSLLVFVFVLDWERQIICDEAVVLGLLGILAVYILFHISLYEYFLSGLLSSAFLLFLHLVTRGAGMGLGDVKFSLCLGTVLGMKLTLVYVFLSFVVGGVFGVFVLAFGVKKLKEKIAFGPFLVLGFLGSVFFGGQLVEIFVKLSLG